MSRKTYLRDFNFTDYSIDKHQKKSLDEFCRKQENFEFVSRAAHEADKVLSPWIVESVTKGKSYDKIEYTARLGRIPCCRTDFYGMKRYFYYRLNERIKGGM